MNAPARTRCAWLVGVALACGAASSSPADVDLGGTVDSRYRLTGAVVAGEPNASPQLRVRVEPRHGWHIAPEAPARLDLESSAGVRFPRERLTREDAAALDEEQLVFTTGFSVEPGAPVTARGQLKFGICEGEDQVCAIVRRDLDIALPEGRP